MIKLKPTSRIGKRLLERTGSTTVGSPKDTPQSSHDVGDNGGPRQRMGWSFGKRLRTVDPDVVSFTGEDPRGRDWPATPPSEGG